MRHVPARHHAMLWALLWPALAAAGGCRCEEAHGPAPLLWQAEHFGIAFEYPAHWRLTQTGEQVLLVLDYSSVAEGGPELFIAAEVLTSLGPDAEPRDLQQVSDAALAVLAALPDYALRLDERATLAGREARHLIVSFTRAGQSYTEELVFVPHRQRYLGLYYVAPTARFEQQRPVYQELLVSLQLRDKPALQ